LTHRSFRGLLPNLLIIGAAKAGTTSLHAYLDRHPAIAMSAKKELQLFSGADWRDRLDWYRVQFPVRAPVRGESSPSYSMDPVLPHVPERAKEIVPGARIIYMVRDPIERLVAQYVEFFAIHREHRSFEEMIRDYDSPQNVYVAASRYGHQLDRWREHYDDAQILVVEQRELLTARRETLQRVFRFLGVDDTFWTPEFDELHNTRDRKLRPNAFGIWLYRRGVYGPALRTATALRARRALGTEIAKPNIGDGLRSELTAHLRADAERLREYTGRAFEHWSV
jgi:Sulfotransferase family